LFSFAVQWKSLVVAMACAGMTQEQIFVSLQNDNAQLKADMVTTKQLLEQATAMGNADGGATGVGKGGKGFDGDWHTGGSAWEKGGYPIG